MANTATVLLALLKRCDAARLEAMLEPTTLLALLVEHGHSKEQMQAELDSGTLPGELLLELFENNGADAVWAAVPARIQSRVDEGERPQTVFDGGWEATWPERIGIITVLCAVVWSTMYVLGAFPEWGRGLASGPATFGILAAAIGGALSRSTERTAGALSAMFGVLFGLFAGWVGAHFVDDPPSRWQTMGVVVAATLPALAVHTWLVARFRRKNTPQAF